jgi:hypothetical protein
LRADRRADEEVLGKIRPTQHFDPLIFKVSPILICSTMHQVRPSVLAYPVDTHTHYI